MGIAGTLKMADNKENQDQPQQQDNLLDDMANYEESEEEFDEDYYSEEMGAEMTAMYEEMNESNFSDFAKKATELKRQEKYDEACAILKLIIRKGAGIFQDELHYKLATYYYQMGDIILEKVENTDDVFGGNLAEMKEQR